MDSGACRAAVRGVTESDRGNGSPPPVFLPGESHRQRCLAGYSPLVCKEPYTSTGCSGLVHWNDPEGWYREGGGRGIQDGEHVYIRGRFMLMYGKTNTIF